MSDQTRRFILTFATLVAIALIVVAVMMADTGPGSVSDTAGGGVEDQIPRPGDQLLRQDRVGIDLAEGWTGTLALDGVEIPETQVTRNPTQNQILFQAGPNKVVTELETGTRCLVARVWEIALGPGTARTVSWCFEVL